MNVARKPAKHTDANSQSANITLQPSGHPRRSQRWFLCSSPVADVQMHELVPHISAARAPPKAAVSENDQHWPQGLISSSSVPATRPGLPGERTT